MTQLLKPTLILYTTSVLVIVFCLFLVSVAIASFTVTWDPCAFVGGLILLPLPATLAVQQYRGTFRHIRSASKMTAILLFVVGGFAAFAFVATFVEIVEGGGELPWFGLLLPMLATSAIGFASGWLNLSWRGELPNDITLTAPQSFSKREIWLALMTIGCMVAVTNWLIRSMPPKYAEHVDIANAPFGLPANATDISFCQGSRGTIAYEFNTDEAFFCEWVAAGIGSLESHASDTQLVPITSPVSILRYNSCSTDLTGPDSIIVAAGLHYSWSFEDHGVYAVFDSSSKRAYYFAHFH